MFLNCFALFKKQSYYLRISDKHPLTPPSKEGESSSLYGRGLNHKFKKMYFLPIQILECTTVFLLFKYNILQDMSVVLLSYRNNK